MRNQSEFYVGYLPMPGGLKKAVRRLVLALAVLVVALAAILIAGQNPFAASNFEFQQYREFSGTFVTEPYPAIAIPGQGLPWLLVGPGKHGAGDFHELNGRAVRLRGERIIRGVDHMIEMLPGSLRPGQQADATVPPSEDLGEMQFTGEVVDSKCFFGVMNPGTGKVHRDCAVRCISGGIPPALLVRDSSGNLVTLLLAHWNRELLDHIAEPVTVRGHLVRSAGRLALYQE
jgi:hypothetical protein